MQKQKKPSAVRASSRAPPPTTAATMSPVLMLELSEADCDISGGEGAGAGEAAGGGKGGWGGGGEGWPRWARGRAQHGRSIRGSGPRAVPGCIRNPGVRCPRRHCCPGGRFGLRPGAGALGSWALACGAGAWALGATPATILRGGGAEGGGFLGGGDFFLGGGDSGASALGGSASCTAAGGTVTSAGASF